METAEILSLAQHAEELSSTFATRISKFQIQVSDHEAKALAAADRAGTMSGEVDPDVKRTVKLAVRNNAKRESHAFQRKLVEGSSAERSERLKSLMELDAKASQLEPLFVSPVQLLSRHGLGSPERSRYQEQLRTAGPRELVNYAQWAVVKGDRLLAAAVLSRLDSLPTAERPVRAVDFANELVGEEYLRAREALRRVRTAVQRATIVNRNFERGRSDGNSRIALGLARNRA